MANVLKVAMQQTIITLLERGRSQRHIARELGISRDAVARHARLWRNGQLEPNQSISTAGSAGRRSACEPFRET